MIYIQFYINRFHHYCWFLMSPRGSMAEPFFYILSSVRTTTTSTPYTNPQLTIISHTQHHEHIRRKCPYHAHAMFVFWSQLPGFLQSHSPGQRGPEVYLTQCWTTDNGYVMLTSILGSARDNIQSSGGVIKHEYSLIKGFRSVFY